MCPQYFHQSSPIIFNFIFSSFHWGRIQDIEFERLGLPVLVHCKGKPFKVSTNYFVFSSFLVLFCKGQPFVSVCFFGYHQRPPLVLTLVFVFHLTSFNSDGKGARDVGLTCRCHLSNMMPDNIFNNWRRQGANFYLVLVFLTFWYFYYFVKFVCGGMLA